MLPFQSLVLEHRELGLVVAVAIGFGFGFVLERAGFGRATKLAAQFYFHDMTVFKVMFGAIITAMSGVVLASSVGLVDLRALSESAVSFTYIWPMLVGGLVLGAGFIISGYCPGTSLVGAASGNVDAVFTFVGVIIGSVIYGEIYPLISSFHGSGEKGFLFLYDILGVPAPVLAAGIVVMAIAMFFGAEKVERIFKKRRNEEIQTEPAQKRQRLYAFGVIGALAAFALVGLALPQKSRAAKLKPASTISQKDLARQILDEPWSLRILDLRNEAACIKARIPGSECVTLDNIGKLGLAYDSGARDLVLVGWQTWDAPKEALAYPGRVFVLDGGWMGWKSFALAKPTPPQPGSNDAEIEAYKFRAALNSAMTGMKPPPPPPATGTAVAKPKKKKGGGCS